jgi:hypothetical protein
MPGVDVERTKVLNALFSFSVFFVLIENFTNVGGRVVVSRDIFLV